MKKSIRTFLVKRKFPDTLFHQGAHADKLCILGKNTVLFKNVHLSNTQIGRFSYIQADSNVYNSDIGPFCSIANNVTIGLAEHPTSMVCTSPVFYDDTQPLTKFFVKGKHYKETTSRSIVGADVWIGQGVMIKSGIHIGTGAVIGAGALVTNDVEPYSVVGGVPAKVIKKRFDETVCNALLVSKWWELSDERLSQLSSSFDDPLVMLETLNNMDR